MVKEILINIRYTGLEYVVNLAPIDVELVTLYHTGYESLCTRQLFTGDKHQ